MFKLKTLLGIFLLLAAGAVAQLNAAEVKADDSVKKTKSAEKLLDPTRPLGFVSKKSEQALNLQAIYFGDGRKEAVINGKLVGEGDVVYGRKIVAIRSNKVIYDVSGVKRSLTLRPSIYK
ncbi:MAG: MSHA biogenesis protein MshK [Agarilytica sp.]